jgi:hypothetical protein
MSENVKIILLLSLSLISSVDVTTGTATTILCHKFCKFSTYSTNTISFHNPNGKRQAVLSQDTLGALK